MEMSQKSIAEVKDPGLDESIKALSTPQIEATVRKVLDKECSGRLKIYQDTCVHCGACATACHTYNSRGGDPRFTPVAKVKDTMWQLVKRKGRVDGEFVKKMARIAFTEGECELLNGF